MKTTALFCIMVLGLGALCNACSSDCGLWFSTAVVSGQVDANNVPVPATEVRVEVLVFLHCGDVGVWTDPVFAVTDSNGKYSVELSVANTTGDMCVRVTETDSGENASDVVEFVGGCSEDRPPELLTIDVSISMPPNPTKQALGGTNGGGSE